MLPPGITCREPTQCIQAIFLRMLPVGRAPYLTLVRPGGAEQPLELEAGDDVLVRSVSVVAPQPGVEGLVARRQHDRPDLDFNLLRRLVEVYGVVLADSRADRSRSCPSDRGSCHRCR